jgi:hypothetical protein
MIFALSSTFTTTFFWSSLDISSCGRDHPHFSQIVSILLSGF